MPGPVSQTPSSTIVSRTVTLIATRPSSAVNLTASSVVTQPYPIRVVNWFRSK